MAMQEEPVRIKNYDAERRMFIIRTIVAIVGMTALISVLVLRLTWLQVLQHDYYTTRSNDNRMRIEIAQPVRGLIYDRNGILLADNLPSYRLEIVPEQAGDLQVVIARLSHLIEIRDVDLERFRGRVKKEPSFRSIPIRSLLNPDEVARFEVNRQAFPGVNIVAGLTRHYPIGATGAHLVGYVGSVTEDELARLDEQRYRGASYVGKTGVERSYENVLHGDPGYRVTEANAAGRLLRQLEYHRPTDGRNLYLTIDTRVQTAAEQALGEAEGAVVALDPATGGILALVSEPSFEPGLFVEGIDRDAYKALIQDPRKPMFNRALQGTFPPGSTIKPFMALAGLEYQRIGPHDHVYCRGAYMLPGSSRRYRDWRAAGHGAVDMTYAILQSCDVYFYTLGNALGIDHIHDFLAQFGFGRPTQVDLPGEKGGLLPSSEWKKKALKERWYAGETLSVAIGQGYLNVTPMQLAKAVGLVAGRGKGMQPHVLKATQDAISGSMKTHEPEPLKPVQVRSANDWAPILAGMLGVVQSANGTAHRIATDAYTIAGKTGTAQARGMSQSAYVKSEHMKKEERDHAWFIAFAPVESPRIAVAVLVEHGGHGGSVAAPIARAVLDAFLVPDAAEVAEKP
jgi:penicillin-binding protein 2